MGTTTVGVAAAVVGWVSWWWWWWWWSAWAGDAVHVHEKDVGVDGAWGRVRGGWHTGCSAGPACGAGLDVAAGGAGAVCAVVAGVFLTEAFVLAFGSADAAVAAAAGDGADV